MDEFAQKFNGFFDALGDLLFAFRARTDDFAVLEQKQGRADVFQAHDGAWELFRFVFDVVDFHGDVEKVQIDVEISGCNDILHAERLVDLLDFLYRFFNNNQESHLPV